LVFEIDDDLWSVPPENKAAHEKFGDPAVRDRLRRNAEAADAVFVSTEPLAKVLGEYNDRVYVLENCVPEGLISMRDAWTTRLDSRVIVGWAGSATHSVDFAVMPRSLFKALDEDRRVTVVHTIGPDFFTPNGVRAGKVARTPWKDDLVDYYRALNFDICLIPLADLPFNTSKSSIKFLEAASLGIPVVASAVGPYAADIEHGVTGFLASSNRDWTRYLDRLLRSPGLRRRIGENARAYARTRAIEGNTWRWEQALAEVISR
jgi:glycosyltransferase involved in cell wall biosynthesis